MRVSFAGRCVGVYEHVRFYGVSERIISAMNRVDRKLFVPPHCEDSAYVDTPLPIGFGQTISAPHMVGIMCEALELSPGLRVLEIGTGSGYNAAVMAELVAPTGVVYSVEIIEDLARSAKMRLEQLGFRNVQVFVGDGKAGLPDLAPFDRIVVTCCARKVPPALEQQLVEGGIMVVPLEFETSQVLKKLKKVNGGFQEWSISFVRFVPML